MTRLDRATTPRIRMLRLQMILTFACVMPLLSRVASAEAPLTDFEDGTPQGWSMSAPSIGTLTVASGGNPGFCLAATDAMPVGAPLLARAPAAFSGDLTRFDSIQWDEFVLDYGSDTVLGTSVLLRSTSGTIWSSSNALEIVGSWNSKSVPFVESAWIQRSGSESFSVVLANVEALFLSMDTAYLEESALESEVDNVALIPATPTWVPDPPEPRAPSWGRIKTVFATR